MLWFSGNQVTQADLEAKIAEATLEAIPNGEIDLSIALEITDLIRSKKLPPKQCMRALKKRLNLVHNNPNLVKLTLQLVDLCVKNCGYHFLVEIALNEFVDYIVSTLFKINYDTKNRFVSENEATRNVGQYILQLLQEWSVYFQGQLQLNTVEKALNTIKHEGYQLPPLSLLVAAFEGNNSTLVDLEVPPDWVDSDECMICYNKFSMLNRKHHCRSCGGVYCGEHSSHTLPLVHLGIMEAVRVCDNCYLKVSRRTREDSNGNNQQTGFQRLRSMNHSSNRPSNINNNDHPQDDDDDLKRAIELSLKETQIPISRPEGPPPGVAPQPETITDEDDEEMKAAIAASLQEFKAKEQLYQQQSEPPEEDFYGSLLPPVSLQQPTGNSYSMNSYNREPAGAPPTSFPQQATGYSVNQNTQNTPNNAQIPTPSQQISDPEEHLNLTAKEEESINLFLTLLNNVKNDPQKRANIIYDSKLSELHSQILQLKPKLNRSLRAAIERYDTFLELNNKLLTIARLYDSYLDSKLQEAYRKHSISSIPQQNTQPQTQEPYYFNHPHQNAYPEQIYQATGAGPDLSHESQRNSYQGSSYKEQAPYPKDTQDQQQQNLQQLPETNQQHYHNEPQNQQQYFTGQYNHPNHQQQTGQQHTGANVRSNTATHSNYGKPSHPEEAPQYNDNNGYTGYNSPDGNQNLSPSEPQADSEVTKFTYPSEEVQPNSNVNQENKHTERNNLLPYPKDDFASPYVTTFPSEPEESGPEQEGVSIVSGQSAEKAESVPEDENEDKVAAKFPSLDEISNKFPTAPKSDIKSQLRYTEEPLIEL